ncbi:MAG TPA: hypothetical protein ENO00_06220 [Deltaproteobacteria bacterium]|jgi:Tfp pilus assembly protein PilX|nr:hypothetical protein [Deltaproteobacteria bacterium]
MKIPSPTIIKNERGYALLVAILVLSLVTMIGYAAVRTSSVELQISGNERQIADNFYDAEGGLVDTLENTGTWMTTAFLTAAETTANYTGTVDVNGDSTDDASVEVRCIESTGTDIGTLSSAANDLPVMSHTGPPPSGSGCSIKYFIVRRYGVTSSNTAGNVQLQVGTWKLFNKN